MTKIISIMGNIGSGKTTIVNELHNLYSFPTIEEPLDEWKRWLDLFYTNPKQFAFSFQMKILYDYNIIKKKLEKIETCVIERSPFESKHIFAKALYKNGDMSEIEHELLTNYFDEYSWKPDVIIYLKLDPEKCLERIKLRNRACESGIQLAYLQSLHNNYEELVSQSEHKIHVIDVADNKINVILNQVHSIICN